MGRGKLPLRLIEKERARRITCMKRKKGLLKKAYELSTLCDIRVCVIVYDAAAEQHDLIRTYPEDPQAVFRIVRDYGNYKIQNPTNSKRDLNLSDFYNDRIKRLETETQKLIQDNDHDNNNNNVDRDHSLFYTWDPRIDGFTETQLSELLAHLDVKIREVNEVRAGRAAAAIVCDASHSNGNNSHYYFDHQYHDHHQGQDQFLTMISGGAGSAQPQQAWPYFHQPSSLVSPGFDQTAQIDHRPAAMMNNQLSYTKLLQAPDHWYALGNIFDFSPYYSPINNNNNNNNAELVGHSYGSSSGQIPCFAGPEQFYQFQAQPPIQAMMGSADDHNNQYLFGSSAYQEDDKFYSSLGIGKMN